MGRRANRIDVDWVTTENNFTWEQVTVEVLQDIREELRTLNRLLRCPNFLAIPAKLDRISRNTAKPKRKKKP